MELTQKNKNYIDGLSYSSLLSAWRFAPTGFKWFEGETGEYWSKRMTELRETVDHVKISKEIGWKSC